MFIEYIDGSEDGSKINYDPYNLTETIKTLIVQGEAEGLGSSDFLKLGENDPILQFFPISDYEISFDLGHNKGRMILKLLKYNRRDGCNISYEFTGDEESFELHIYNLSSCRRDIMVSDIRSLKRNWENYIRFLEKLYPEADISFDYYFHEPFSNKKKNRNKLRTLTELNFNTYFEEEPNSNYNGT